MTAQKSGAKLRTGYQVQRQSKLVRVLTPSVLAFRSIIYTSVLLKSLNLWQSYQVG